MTHYLKFKTIFKMFLLTRCNHIFVFSSIVAQYFSNVIEILDY